MHYNANVSCNLHRYYNEIPKTRPPKRIGENRVAVPTKFFKVLCMQRKGKWQAIGFVMPNSSIKGSMFDYAVTVDEVERLTDTTSSTTSQTI